MQAKCVVSTCLARNKHHAVAGRSVCFLVSSRQCPQGRDVPACSKHCTSGKSVINDFIFFYMLIFIYPVKETTDHFWMLYLLGTQTTLSEFFI